MDVHFIPMPSRSPKIQGGSVKPSRECSVFIVLLRLELLLEKLAAGREIAASIGLQKGQVVNDPLQSSV
jgi:hypothetical protein